MVRAGAGIVKILAAILQPFMPSISKKILYQLNIDWTSGIRLTTSEIEAVQNPCTILPHGHKINEPVPLFNKISEKELQGFRQQFKGRQEETEVVKKKNYKKMQKLWETIINYYL